MAPRADPPLKRAYLFLYNAASAVAWATVLGRTVLAWYARGHDFVPLVVAEWARWTQTVALLEVAHSLLGIVRAPVATTVMQVASRILLVHGIVAPFPFLAREHLAYATMLLAWSLTEVVRYTYFALQVSGVAWQPLVWTRYSSFLPLYPIGITSEWIMIWHAVPRASEIYPMYGWALYAVLGIYFPGSYVLYMHMLRQRKKVLGGAKGVEKTQ